MLDFSHIPTGSGVADVQVFVGSSASNNAFLTWVKPRGKSMCHIFLLGKGGNGGAGVIGANSTAAGGGGGGSGGQTSIMMPLSLLPDVLYLRLGHGNSGNINSGVSVVPDLSSSTHNLVVAYSGIGGGNASGATAGTAGAGGAAANASIMPLGWSFATQVLAGQSGIAGGTTGAAGALTLPTTGLLVTGGTGGAGLGAAGATGTAGGDFTAAGVFPTHKGGTGGSTSTTPPVSGTGGYKPIQGLGYWYGGTGGGSTHGSATGAGLVQASGGNGAFGCGGGGSGGALTGSTAGVVGEGGPALCIITCW